MKRTEVSHDPINAEQLRARCAQMADPVDLLVSTESHEQEQRESSSRKRSHRAEAGNSPPEQGFSSTSTISASSNHHILLKVKVEEERERDFQSINTNFEDMKTETEILQRRARKLYDSLEHVLNEMMDGEPTITELTHNIETQQHSLIEQVRTASLTKAEKYEELQRIKSVAHETYIDYIRPIVNISQSLFKCERWKRTTQELEEHFVEGYPKLAKHAWQPL